MKSQCPNVFLMCSVSLFLISNSLNILPIAKVNAQSSTVLSVQPPLTEPLLGDVFQVDVNVTDVTDLYGYEFRLFYNMYVLTALDLEPAAASANGPGFFFTNQTGQGWKVWKYEINNNDPYGNGTGYVWLAVTRPLSVRTGLSGSGRLARITFSADYVGTSALTFDVHTLGDHVGLDIEHSVSEGMVVVNPPPNIAITNIELPKTIEGQGFNLHINVTVQNLGISSEDLTVTLYANTTIIDTQTKTLIGYASTTLSFTWETAGVAMGNYTVSAYATPVPGETNTLDNTYTDGTVLVTIPGDINGDRKINVIDATLLSVNFGRPDLYPNGDINSDDNINILDSLLIISHWGQSW